MITDKSYEFDFNGGIISQEIQVSGNNLPLTLECNSEWINASLCGQYLKAEIKPQYGYENRGGMISVTDRFGNLLNICVIQSGYRISIDCPTSIYIPDMDYGLYVTVFGGYIQMLSCDELQDNVEEVWDNSDMYNDFIISIPRDYDGTMVVSHSESRMYIEYCIKNNISFNESDFIKSVKIKHVKEEDIVGSLVVEINGVEYTKDDTCVVYINNYEDTEIGIKSTSYYSPITEPTTESTYHEKNDVVAERYARWVSVKNNGDKLLIRANEPNNFSTKECIMRIKNANNPKQYLDVRVVQNKS